jgi:hypothetical protein
VCRWLAEEGLASLQAGFRAQAVDGEVLLTLTQDDMGCLGVPTLGGKAKLVAKIETVKKQYYAGQVVGIGGDGDGGMAPNGDGVELSAEQHRLVLEHVLQENATLADRIQAMRADAPAGAAPPSNFVCPITTEVMTDPVFAMDGHT